MPKNDPNDRYMKKPTNHYQPLGDCEIENKVVTYGDLVREGRRIGRSGDREEIDNFKHQSELHSMIMQGRFGQGMGIKEPQPIYSGPELPYHRDKNGREIKYCKVRHDCGKIYDIHGTGLKMPGDGYSLLAWNEDDKLVFLDTRDVVVHDESIESDIKEMAIVAAVVLAILLPVAITAKLSFGW